MKQQIHPVAAGILVAILVLIVGGFLWMKTGGAEGGKRPTPEQAASGPMLGNKRMPGAAGGDASAQTHGGPSGSQ